MDSPKNLQRGSGFWGGGSGLGIFPENQHGGSYFCGSTSQKLSTSFWRAEFFFAKNFAAKFAKIGQKYNFGNTFYISSPERRKVKSDLFRRFWAPQVGLGPGVVGMGEGDGAVRIFLCTERELLSAVAKTSLGWANLPPCPAPVLPERNPTVDSRRVSGGEAGGGDGQHRGVPLRSRQPLQGLPQRLVLRPDLVLQQREAEGPDWRVGGAALPPAPAGRGWKGGITIGPLEFAGRNAGPALRRRPAANNACGPLPRSAGLDSAGDPVRRGGCWISVAVTCGFPKNRNIGIILELPIKPAFGTVVTRSTNGFGYFPNNFARGQGQRDRSINLGVIGGYFCNTSDDFCAYHVAELQ